MKKLLLFGLLAVSMLVACDKENGTDFPEPEPIPTPKPDESTFLKLSTNIELMDEVTTKAPISQFQRDDEIGLFYNDTCLNKKFTFNGSSWSGGAVALSSTLKNIYCYFPYSSNINAHDNIPIDVTSQTDYLAGTAIVGTSAANAEVEMKHVLSLVRVTFKKNNYPGAGHIESVIWNGIHKQAKYNLVTSTLTPIGERGSYQAGGNFIVDDNKAPIVVEAILLPVSTAEGISLTVRVDGEDRTYQIPAVHQWETAKAYTYTLTLKGGYNSPIDLEEYPIDVQHWSSFGKTDNIVLGTSDRDFFSIEPGNEGYGIDVYRNEGFMFGFLGYWMGFDPATGNMPDKWEGDFRMVLIDNSGNIVDKFQPCAIIANNGEMMKGTGRRSYVTAPAGTYELGVLFRKKGETTWIKADRKDNVTKQDLMFTIKEQTNLPALRMIQVEEEANTGVVIHKRPYDSNFNIVYTLSNRGNIALRGEIKAVWERTFDYVGHCYRPCSKRMNTTNDNTWQDEIGRVSIDLQPTVRFWHGIIPCKFPIKREYPKTADGIGYCTPMVHLYWKAESSSEWVLLRCDLDEILAAQVNTSQEEANLFLKSLNYINFQQDHWW